MKRTSLWLLAAVALPATIVPALAQDGSTTITQTTAAAPVDISRLTWFEYPTILDRALDGKVDKNGVVDYAALKGDADLNLFVRAIALADVSKFPVLTIQPKIDERTGMPAKGAKPTQNRDAELAFWINAYNASILQTIARAYPINSPDEIKGFDSDKTHRVAGRDWSLREMRLKIVGMDPRAFFSLTNGARGGPLLASGAYRFLGLNRILNINASTFLNDKRNIELVRIQNKVTLSDVLQDANDLFASQATGRKNKMAGLRYLLSAYSDQRGDRSYFTTNDYQIALKKSDRRLNSKA